MTQRMLHPKFDLAHSGGLDGVLHCCLALYRGLLLCNLGLGTGSNISAQFACFFCGGLFTQELIDNRRPYTT